MNESSGTDMSEVDKIAADTLAWLEPLLAIVRCPHMGRVLRPITVPELRELLSPQRRCPIPEGTIGALVAEGSPVAYPILGPIVDFLEQDALHLPGARENPPRIEDSPSAAIKNSVKAWYDLFGWKKGADGRYGDTALFSQTDRSAHAFYEMDSHLQFLDCLPGGRFLLDAASGPVAHPEYKSYSRHYQYRVCVDLSYTALQEAAARIGRHGFYCMADLCHLPFRDNVFDAVVSGYAIQHIPESDQLQAIAELHRVLARGRLCCIMTDLRVSLAGRITHKFLRTMGGATQRSRRFAPGSGRPSSPVQPGPLYYCPRSRRWWRNTLSHLGCAGSAETLRLLEKSEFERLFGNSRRAARILRRLERALPRMSAPFARYGLIRFCKTAHVGG
jgi:SAM-dependent methyltransferase